MRSALLTQGVEHDLEHDVWNELELRMAENWASGTRVLGVGIAPDAAERFRELLKGAGAEVVAFAPRLDRMLKENRLVTAFSHVLVNIDAYGDVLQAVDVLLLFRKAAPKTTIVCMTKGVRSDDLSLERRQICDATLRIPFDVARLKQAFVAATDNHSRSRWLGAIADGDATETPGPVGRC